MGRAHLVVPVVALSAGIIAERSGLGPVALGVTAALAFVLTTVPLGVRATFTCALAAGLVSSRAHPAVVLLPQRTATFSAICVGESVPGANGQRFLARLSSGTVVSVQTAGIAPRAGQQLVLRGRLEPFDEPRNPGEPSLRDIEAERGVAGQLSSARMLALGPLDASDPTIFAARIREWAGMQIRGLIAEPAAGILTGILWGGRDHAVDALRPAFQDTGTVHVLVTAGLHLGFSPRRRRGYCDGAASVRRPRPRSSSPEFGCTH